MTKIEVIDVLGKPQGVKRVIIAGKDYEAWYYPVVRKWTQKIQCGRQDIL